MLGHFPWVFHPVDGAEGDVDGLVFGNEFYFAIDSHFGCAIYDDPVFGAVVVAL